MSPNNTLSRRRFVAGASNQQVIIRELTPGVEPDATTKRQALEHAQDLSRKAAKHRDSLGVSEAEADQIVDEAMDHVRQRKSQ